MAKRKMKPAERYVLGFPVNEDGHIYGLNRGAERIMAVTKENARAVLHDMPDPGMGVFELVPRPDLGVSKGKS